MTSDSAADSAEGLTARYGAAYRWLVTGAGMCGVLSMVLAMTTVNVAVPDVMGAFGIGQDKAQWMSSAYIATMTSGMLLSVWLVSVLGERRAFVGSLFLFSIGAVLGGTARHEDVLIFARVLQGFSAGIAQPLVMATIFSVFPADRRGTAMGVFGLGVVFAPAIGPTLGGLMIEFFSWHYVFFISLPFCVLAGVLGLLFMPTRALPEALPKFDWVGFALLCIGLYGLMAGFADGQREGWQSDLIVLRLASGFAAAIGFVLWELRVDKPLLEIRMFAIPAFAASAVAAFIFGACLMGSTYLVPVFVQTTQAFSPLEAGLMLMPAGLLLAVIFPLAGRLADTVSPALIIMVGLLIYALSLQIMSTTDANTTFWTLAGVTLISRLGLGFVNPSLNASSLKALPPELVRQGAGASNFLRMLGGAFGINLGVVFLEWRTRFHAEALTATQDYANSTTRQLLRQVEHLLAQTGLPQTVQKNGALEYLGSVVQSQSVSLAFQDTFIVGAIVALAAVPPAFLLSRSQRRQRAPPLQAPAGEQVATRGNSVS